VHRLFFCVLLLGPLAAASEDSSLRVLKVDIRDAPRLRVYFEAPTADWAESTASVSFGDKLSAEEVAALAWLETEKKKESPAKDLPEVPEFLYDVNGAVVAFSKQSDPSEALRVELLVDASQSMGEFKGARLAEVRAAVYSVMGKLREGDQVQLTRFASVPESAVSPTVNHEAIINALATLTLFGDADKTRIFDAVQASLLRFEKEPLPALPGRRFLLLFSDGEDRESAAQVNDVLDLLKGDSTKRPVLFTIGCVGQTRTAPPAFNDLRLLGTTRFSIGTDRTPLVQQVEEALSALNTQLLVEFDLPPYYTTTGRLPLTITFKGAAGTGAIARLGEDAINLDVLSAAATQAGVEYREALAKAVTRHQKSLADGEADDKAKAATEKERLEKSIADKEADDKAKAATERERLEGEARSALDTESEKASRRARIGYAIGGGAILRVIIIAAVALSRSKRRRREAQVELERVQSSIEQRMSEQEGRLVQEARLQATQQAARARRPLAVLLATSGPLKGQAFGLLNPSVTVGRDADKCDVIFPSEGGDVGISRVHAQFRLGGGAWTVLCLADGGMRLAGRAVRKNEEYPVTIGDTVTLGKTDFRFDPP